MRAHLDTGKPLLGIRTASHAFAPRGDDANKGAAWVTFDPDVLGGSYVGHHGNGARTTLAFAPGAEGNPILTGVNLAKLSGNGSLYRVSPLKPDARPLLIGTVPDKDPEPVAWTRAHGPKQARVFYTSLGHADDFANPEFRRLLLNAMNWAMSQPIPPAQANLIKP